MAWKGEDLKLKIELKAEGFDIDRDSYKLVLKRGSTTVDIENEEIAKDGEDHFLCLKANRLEQLGVGDVYLVAYAYVPDEHFQDGIRTEIDKQLLTKIVKI